MKYVAIPRQHAPKVTATFMAILMSMLISLVLSFLSYGFSIELVPNWLGSWLRSSIIAVPAAIILLPRVKRVVDEHTRKSQ